MKPGSWVRHLALMSESRAWPWVSRMNSPGMLASWAPGFSRSQAFVVLVFWAKA